MCSDLADRPQTVFVSARPEWNNTGLELSRGRTYRISPNPTDEWRDARRRCGAGGWRSWWFQPLHFLKRNRSANWLGLVAAIGDEETFVFPDEIDGGLTIVPAVGGHLRFYANDASFMYWNNSGEIRVTIADLTPYPGRVWGVA